MTALGFGVKSSEFNYLCDRGWEQWINDQLEEKLQEIQEEFEELSIKDRETKAYGIEIDDIIYGEYCDNETIHHDIFNTDNFWYCECEAIERVDTPKEMLYIIQYVAIKVAENDMEFDIEHFHKILDLFAYFFSKDLLYDTCRLEKTIMFYTDRNYDRICERLKLCVLFLNRKQMPMEMSMLIRQYIFSEEILERIDYIKLFN